MSLDGALFDLPKLLNISKDVIAYYDAAKVVSEATEYAKKYSPELLSFIQKDENRFYKIMNIERNQDHPRKDYEKYSDIYGKVKFFDADIYNEMLKR